jgi:S-methylmethionine-dependent homocysteine/selenocysteine methylase
MAADYNGARSNPRRALHDGLSERGPLVLDGATGTELQRRGVRATLPLWSSWGLLEAPDVVRAIHADYVRAGVDLLTAATFRTHARSLAEAGFEARAEELCRLAVRLARDAAEPARRPVLVLGSAAPLEDCYQPERVPDDATLAREHARHARHLVRAGVDGILVETINTLREGVAAARAGREAGADVLVSFVCGDAARLLSGEPLAEAIDAVSGFGPRLVGVNCLAPGAAAACLPVLRNAGVPFLVYTNAGAPGASDPETFAAHARRWVEAGAACVGGCCGTGPAHLRALGASLARVPHPAAQ